MICRRESHLWLSDVPEAVQREICTELTVENPRYADRKKLGKPLTGIDPVRRYWASGCPGQLRVPGGALHIVLAAAEHHGEIVRIDEDVQDAAAKIELRTPLRLYQELAVAELLAQGEAAVLEAPTGSGKTIMALAMMAERCCQTLIVVHTVRLLEQWIERITEHTSITNEDICRIGDGRVDIRPAPVTVAVINTLEKCVVDVLKTEQASHLVVDECHRVVGDRYAKTIGKLRPYYRLGLSATPWRRDTLGPAINYLLGPTVSLGREPLLKSGALLPIAWQQIDTGWSTETNASEHYSTVLSELSEDVGRTSLIANQILDKLDAGITLVLTDRRELAERIYHALNRRAAKFELLAGFVALQHGGLQTTRMRLEKEVIENGARIIVATVQLLGEGFDLPSASVLHLASPTRFDGRVLQALGRVLRPAPGQRQAWIYDYVDSVGVLRNSARERARLYQEIEACQR